MTEQEIARKIQILSQKYNIAIKSSKWSEALKISQEVVSITPKSAVCYNYRGFSYFKLGNVNRARLDFEHALTLDPKNKNARSMLEKIEKISVIVCDENETVPLNVDEHKLVVQGHETEPISPENHQTQVLPPIPKTSPPQIVAKSNFLEDAFLEESTTEAIQENRMAVVGALETNDEYSKSKGKNVLQQFFMPIVLGVLTLIVGVFIGVFFLGNNKALENNTENNSDYLTIFDSPTNDEIDLPDLFDGRELSIEKSEGKAEKILREGEEIALDMGNKKLSDEKKENITPNSSFQKIDEKIQVAVKENTYEKVSETEVEKKEKDLKKIDEKQPVLEKIDEKQPVLEKIVEKQPKMVESAEKMVKEKIIIDFMGVAVDLVRSRNIVFVIDNSSSMKKLSKRYNKTRWGLVLESVYDMFPQFVEHKIKINTIIFNQKVNVFSPEMKTANDNLKTKIKGFLDKKSPENGTNLYDAIDQALKIPNVDTIIIICDGPPGTGKYVTYSDIIRNITTENTQKAIIHTVCLFALGSTKKFLQDLAKQNNGNFYAH